MRSIPIPVDVSRLTFVVVTDPRPTLVSQHTGEVKTDRNGQTVYQVGLSAADATGRVELVNVSVSGEPACQGRAGRRACRAGRVRLGADPQRRDAVGHRLPRRRHHPGHRGPGRLGRRTRCLIPF